MKIKLLFVLVSLSLGYGRFALAVEENQNEKKYSYNEGFLLGNAKDISIDKLTEDQITPGNWYVDLYLNNEFLYNKEIRFYENEQGRVVPCLTKEDVDGFNIKPEYLGLIESNGECEDLKSLSKDVQVNLKQDILRLDILIPQAMVEYSARGSVPISALNEGVPAFL
ncbi:FimD/PapC N-terminal domain-containing protein [Providencia stuartii]|uniref:PapC N-terminal domain-containing protein n=1 Tax=Providencia stuartii ATCC 25827 TaxID=471874 RepID=A0AA86YS27_PROST|nr:hypothetical protein PROSTU_04637 [Providencia stuartii ATCC 25827]